jgi:predicted aspartyl protease
MRRMALLLVALLFVLRWPAPVDAQIYRWVDDNGVPHFADGIDSVPGPYRAKAVPLGMKNSPAPPTAPAGAKPAAGETSIPFVPGQRILVDARINGSANAKLLLDTGADKTLVSPRALQAAGVRIAGPTTTAEVAGATGSAQMQFVFVDSIEVGEARVGRMAVGSQNLPIEEADGVLGRDFLDQFNVNIDSSKGVVTLSPK